MPKKLDDCVRKVKAQLISEGESEEKAESRSWAICKSELQMKKLGQIISESITTAVSGTIKQHFKKE